MAFFEKRPSGWRAQVRMAGHPSQSQTFGTKAQAQSWAHEVETAIRDGKRGIVKATLQDAIDKYIRDVCPSHKSGDNMAKRLKALSRSRKDQKPYLPASKQLADLKADDFTTFRERRLAEVSVATVRKEMNIVRSVLESARRDWSMISVNSIADVKRPSAPPDRKRLMLDGERDRLLMALGYEGKVETTSHQVAVAMLLALETAMRAGEMLALTWDRVNLPGRYVSLELTKNGDRRDVPLSTTAVALLQGLRGLDASAVFTLKSPSLDTLFRKARGRCEIKDLHFHDTRATALTNLATKLDVLELARMVGHRDIKSLMIYYRPTATTLAQKLG